MTMPTDPTSVGEDFPNEQRRCRELLEQYRRIGPAGAFGAAMIEAAITEAEQAQASGDVVRIVRAYTALQRCR